MAYNLHHLDAGLNIDVSPASSLFAGNSWQQIATFTRRRFVPALSRMFRVGKDAECEPASTFV
jgi:hypothetical protein